MTKGIIWERGYRCKDGVLMQGQNIVLFYVLYKNNGLNVWIKWRILMDIKCVNLI